MRVTTRSLATVALLFLVVAAGCSGGGGSGDAVPQAGGLAAEREEPAEMATGTPMATEAASFEDDGGAGGGDVVVQERARIRTGRLVIEVEDFDAARRNLTATAEAYGGFVSDTREELNRVGNDTYTTGTVVLRVPKRNFTGMMQDARAQGTVLESSQDTRDVTEQLVDINARLKNLRAQRDRLRALYEQANDTEAILKIEERLSDVQTEIERLEARKQSLERQVALSTIRVELREPRPDFEPPDREQWYETGVVAAFLESVDGVVVVARAMVVATAYALPYVVVFGTPLVAVAVLLRRRRRDSDDAPSDDAEVDDAGEE